MIDLIKLTIPGKLKGKGRPRHSEKNGRMYTPTETQNYEELIRLMYKGKYGNQQFSKGVPLDIRIKSFIAVPKSDSARIREKKLSGEIRPTQKPDYDNIAKIVSDALNGVAYHDDAQIVDAQVRKFFSLRPRVEITILQAGGTIHE